MILVKTVMVQAVTTREECVFITFLVLVLSVRQRIRRDKMYLIIMEDGKLVITDDLEKETIISCDDGYCDIVRLSDCTQYFGGAWEPIGVIYSRSLTVRKGG